MDVSELGDGRFDMIKDLPGLQMTILGNTVYSYLLSILSFMVICFVLLTLKKFIRNKVEYFHAKSNLASTRFLDRLVKRINPTVIGVVALYLATRRLELIDWLDKGIRYLTLVVITIQAIQLLSDFLTVMITKSRILVSRNDPSAQNTKKNIAIIIKAALWIGGFLFILDNFGINISALIAGLGIGGIAIALAAQAILGDAFSSFAITLDKPFEVGDFIIAGDMMGSVEHIGLKTTRVRSLTGELLVFGNSDLTSSRIRNYQSMAERRVNFQIRVTYDTTLELLKLIPTLIKNAIENIPQTRFDRAHFASYGDSALIFDVVYYVLSPDFNLYMDIQQEINLQLHEDFSQQGIFMALPTQVLKVVPKKKRGKGSADEDDVASRPVDHLE